VRRTGAARYVGDAVLRLRAMRQCCTSAAIDSGYDSASHAGRVFEVRPSFVTRFAIRPAFVNCNTLALQSGTPPSALQRFW